MSDQRPSLFTILKASLYLSSSSYPTSSLTINQIISGNEKVVRPRLADAEFFNTDLKSNLIDRLPTRDCNFPKTVKVRFEVAIITELAGYIADKIGADVDNAKRAGLLAKCDLMTSMVFSYRYAGVGMPHVTMASKKM